MTLIYIYITIFTVYFILLSISDILFPKRKIRDKYTPKDSNLCVVVYATGATDTLETLIKQLKSQHYPRESYNIYAILDKCETVPEITLQSDINVNVININNLEPIGKSQAYSIIADKLQETPNLDAFVFLDSKNYIDSEFLADINFYLTKYDVFNPNVIYLPQDGEFNFWQNVKAVYSKYMYKFIYQARTALGLTNIINTDSFIIKKDLLNKIAVFDFRSIISEVEYTLRLAREGVKVVMPEDLRVYDSIDKFDYRTPSLSKRLSIFKSNIFKQQDLISREFLLSLAAPNWLVFVLCYTVLLVQTHTFSMMLGSYSSVLISAALLGMAFCRSLIKMKFNSKEYLYLLSYPALSLGKLLYDFPPCRGVRNLIYRTTHKRAVEKMTTDIIVTDGVRDIPCKLELISEDGLAKVRFINSNGKSYTTKNNHLRMIDAVRELTQKLSEYGLILKVCQCCKYFQPVVDGTTNMVKGTCGCAFEGRTPGDIIPTLIWNTCPKFEQHNVVNLF